MKTYSIPAAAQALGIAESAMEGKKSVTIAEILTLSDNPKLKRYTEEAAQIKELLRRIKELEK